MTNSIHKIKPERTCEKSYANYQRYKPYLRDDFNKRCGYCDDLDYHSGGKRGYHIDHFKPHSITCFASLKQTYSNLVYACPFCNETKSNKWLNVGGFLDPCKDDYNNHLCRNAKGQIEYLTDQGKYIFENLNLGLIRHELLWCIDKLDEQIDKIKLKIDELGEEREEKLKLLRAFMEVQSERQKYTNLFQETI